ncbi:MAG: hypothetical protein WAU11_01150 [Ignavibacteriaceae bacterium]
MIENLKDYLVGIAIGIRYRANFTIEDQLGKIADQILYTPDSYFSANLFPMVYTNLNEKVLIDETTNDHLTINNSNLILEINFGNKFNVSDIDEIFKHFNNEIIDGILKKYKITEINRIGIINRYLFKINELADVFINKTIGSTLEGINDINLRFSKKLTAAESLIKKGVNDYYSAIFNVIKTSDRDELFMSIDYQKYFDPFLPSSSEIEFEEFVKRVNGFNSKTYLNWLNKNYGKLK